MLLFGPQIWHQGNGDKKHLAYSEGTILYENNSDSSLFYDLCNLIMDQHRCNSCVPLLDHYTIILKGIPMLVGLSLSKW